MTACNLILTFLRLDWKCIWKGLLFYKELAKQLKNLGLTMRPFEPYVHYLESWKDGHRTLHGVLGAHVGDGICGGDEWFHFSIEMLRRKLPFRSFKQRKFVFTGI